MNAHGACFYHHYRCYTAVSGCRCGGEDSLLFPLLFLCSHITYAQRLTTSKLPVLATDKWLMPAQSPWRGSRQMQAGDPAEKGCQTCRWMKPKLCDLKIVLNHHYEKGTDVSKTQRLRVTALTNLQPAPKWGLHALAPCTSARHTNGWGVCVVGAWAIVCASSHKAQACYY